MSSANVDYVSDAHVWNERYNILLLVHTELAVNLGIISKSKLLFIELLSPLDEVIEFRRTYRTKNKKCCSGIETALPSNERQP